MALPSGYKRLLYVRADGKVHINTMFKPDNNTRVVMDFKAASISGGPWFFGVRNSSAVESFSLFAPNSTEIRSVLGSNTVAKSSIPSLLQRVTIDKNKTNLTITYPDGTIVTATNSANTFSSQYNLYLLNINLAGSADGTSQPGDLYSSQVYDNGTIVRDYIPCETDAGAVGFWEDVNGTFEGGTGSGSFTAGPEIGADRFPVSYRRLPFIRSTGAQYTNTRVLPSNTLQIEIEWAYTALNGYSTVVGTQADARNYIIREQSGVMTLWAGNTSKTIAPISANQRINLTVSYGDGTYSFSMRVNDGAAITGSGDYTFTGSSFPFFLFNSNVAGEVGNQVAPEIACAAELCSCKFRDNGTLIRDYIPCETNSGEVGLWDTADLRFYGNEGTGEFINPLSPVGDHNTNIGNVAREIDGMTANIGGVVREVKSGTVLVNGVAREIKQAPDIFTVKVTGTFNSYYCYVQINGVTYTSAATLEVEEGATISATVKSAGAGNMAYVNFNGTRVATSDYYTTPGTYTFAVTGNVTVKGGYTIKYDTYGVGIIEITME